MKETSLIFILNKEIRESGYISYQRMVQICQENGRKPSNGERRLRRSESPTVEAVMNEKGAITGYKYKPEFKDFQTIVISKEKEKVVGLFPSYHFKEKSEIIQDKDWTKI